MNVVGKVGSLISQGVYSVATPFHPFGGAIDVIVVKQQDGSFLSTPWYVRFGKFQGVLKGAEKFVRITVNGVEANFHMYLDNSGEAYFVREVDLIKESETSGDMKGSVSGEGSGSFDDIRIDNSNKAAVPTLEHCMSDSVVAQLRDDCESSGPGRLERAESDLDQRYYEFQDDPTSLESSEYGPNRYDNLDVEQFGEAQVSDSEVVLVSVDGHLLTAPISTSEENAGSLDLSNPSFHLGPGEGPGICEGNGEFGIDENPRDADHIQKLETSIVNAVPANTCSVNSNGDAVVHRPEPCEGEGSNICQMQEIHYQVDEESGGQKHSNLEDDSTGLMGKDVYGSCLELTELTKDMGNANYKEIDRASVSHSSLRKFCQNHMELGKTEDQDTLVSKAVDVVVATSATVSEGNDTCRHLEAEVQNSPEQSPRSYEADYNAEDDHAVVSEINDVYSLPSAYIPQSKDTSSDLWGGIDGTLKIASDIENMVPGRISTSNDSGCEVKEDGALAGDKEIEGSLQGPIVQYECSKSEAPARTSSEGIQTDASILFEVSLCRNELRAGIGCAAAAEVFNSCRVSIEEFKNSAASIIKNDNLVVRYKERYLTWDKAAPIVLGMAAFGLDLPVEPGDSISVEQETTIMSQDDASRPRNDSSRRRWRLWPIPFRRVRTLDRTSSNSSNEEIFVDSESSLQNLYVDPSTTTRIGSASPRKKLIRTNVPTSEQIASLNLQEGQNMVTFSFSTRVLGTQQVDAHIYLWMWNARIVISDVDGTITKSDVLGQFMPLVGKDWTQSGVAKLFSAIKENGYQLLFLSARAIVQAYLTRSFLLNLKQDGKALPNGPVVISPDGLFPSLYREVIRRAPHEFKIACLEDIKRLFPPDYNPFYAGFGNRDTDELSYRKIGIPKGKIFIINPKGEVATSHCIDAKSYTSLHTLVNDMFPPTSLVEQEDFNSWNYWRMPLPDIEL